MLAGGDPVLVEDVRTRSLPAADAYRLALTDAVQPLEDGTGPPDGG